MLTIILFFSLLILGVPIAFLLGVMTILYILTSGNWILLESVPQRMFSGLQNFSLLAIPMFILVGEIMNAGGITNRLIQFSTVVFGHLRGGLAYVNVISNMLLASMIGSANAQTAMMSKIMVPSMERQGYRKEFSAALTAASSIMGPLIPPSMPFIIYGVTAGVSVGSMFVAGIIPGILFGILFMFIIYMLSMKHGFPKYEKSSWTAVLKASISVLPALSIPVVILFGILTGVFTATESASIATVLALIVSILLYKELRFNDLYHVLVNTVITSATVAFLIAVSSIFSWVLSYERVPQQVANAFVQLADQPIIFLLLVNILLLVIGMFMEGVSALILLIPILLPIAIDFGINPIQFGVIMVLNLTIGLMTPPVGTVLFIAASAGNVPMMSLVKALIPFLLAAIVLLFIITYFPSITLSLL